MQMLTLWKQIPPTHPYAAANWYRMYNTYVANMKTAAALLTLSLNTISVIRKMAHQKSETMTAPLVEPGAEPVQRDERHRRHDQRYASMREADTHTPHTYRTHYSSPPRTGRAA